MTYKFSLETNDLNVLVARRYFWKMYILLYYSLKILGFLFTFYCCATNGFNSPCFKVKSRYLIEISTYLSHKLFNFTELKLLFVFNTNQTTETNARARAHTPNLKSNNYKQKHIKGR